jgi:hypothetical protein
MKKPPLARLRGNRKNRLLIVTGAAFGQYPDGLTISSWGRAVFVPFQGEFPDDGDAVFKSGVGAGWKPAYMGLNFRFSALDGRVGGMADISHGDDKDGGGSRLRVGDGDNANIWVKPFGTDILYIAVGKIVDGRFRGLGSVDDDFHGYIGGFGDNGDPVFNRFEDDGSALFISQPIDGLSIFANIRPGYDTFNSSVPDTKAADAFKKIQAGFAYDIAGIGFARAQWFGDTMDYVGAEWHPARIEAAFRLTAVEGLNLDLGVKLPIPIEEGDQTYQDNFQINVIGDYTAGDFKVAYSLFGHFGGSTANKGQKRSDLQPSLTALVIPSFYVAAIDFTVGAEVGFKAEGESSIHGLKQDDNGFTFGLGGWIARDLGKGKIKTGLAYQFPKYGDQGTPGPSYLSWPIILEVWF